MTKIIKLLLIVFYLGLYLFIPAVGFCQEENFEADSDQQILQFELSGFGDKGKRAWDVEGKSADIFSETVKLNDIVANVYGEEDNVNLTADSGVYNKAQGSVHLQDNVVVTTESGAKLVTDSLDWQQQTQQVSTKDNVDIVKQNIKVVGKGIEAEPNLKKVKLNEEVKVDIENSDFSFSSEEEDKAQGEDKEPITITCDGPLNVDYENQIAVFNNNVKVTHSQGSMQADKMIIHFDMKGKSIERVESHGNVKILNGENITYSQEAIYTAKDKKVVLTGRPRLVIYSSGGLDASFGN
ncbi:MAG: LPS export ABC transporter periplasmic protein LptC [Candidatus Omnitrophica bacterium CG11_big_fil_rev_8_21_14_0_20_42_13]|uniref:LPS export ABC transporter periplasmic protein LptC n=1 Tax=Candidatus Ghiorseimicrobium undicola TaxID=1974746 RepID=A0A2H0LWX6_9BACT|nr:MAG: LPS export ABC transporter periplasmic protein LptC [Candidatus Omnitrophica bacterium CG11_big_fil_rev_8_21_14_0_20_42_13]